MYWSDAFYYIAIILGFYFGQLVFTIGARHEPNVGVQAVLQSTFVLYSLKIIRKVKFFSANLFLKSFYSLLIDVFMAGNSVSLINYVGCAVVTVASVWAVLLKA